MEQSGPVDRLVKTSVAAARLGLHLKDVRRLARLGLLRGKLIVIRGKNKRPRMMIIESSIQEYIDGLPDAAPIPSDLPAPVRRRAKRGRLEGVIEFV
jgi:hypothetical protein